MLDSGMQLRPVLPPDATYFAFKGIKYMGISIAMALLHNGTVMEVAVSKGVGGLTLTDAQGNARTLTSGGATWSGPPQRVILALPRDTRA